VIVTFIVVLRLAKIYDVDHISEVLLPHYGRSPSKIRCWRHSLACIADGLRVFQDHKYQDTLETFAVLSASSHVHECPIPRSGRTSVPTNAKT
jgi:hypothetical protein